MLSKFYNAIDHILNSEEDLLAQLKQLRDLLKISLLSSDFRLECVERVLDTMDCASPGTNVELKKMNWHAPPIYYHEHLKYSIRIIFWPCFYENNPHEHKTWGVTGVLHNELNVNIYEMLDSPKRLKKKSTITATGGEVGYLEPGCIHNVNNASHELSASFHIFNNVADINHPEENAIWYPSPRRHNLSKGLVDRALLTCLAITSNINSERSFTLINRIYAYSSLPVKLAAVKSLYRFDRCFARNRFNELEAFL